MLETLSLKDSNDVEISVEFKSITQCNTICKPSIFPFVKMHNSRNERMFHDIDYIGEEKLKIQGKKFIFPT